jgi:hypothetical protein
LLIAEVTNENNFFEVSLPQPNPAQDKTQIIIKSTENFEWNYRLLDNIGKLIIQSENKFENTGYGNLGLNLNNLSIGVYILEINTSKGKYIRKIIKLQ